MVREPKIGDIICVKDENIFGYVTYIDRIYDDCHVYWFNHKQVIKQSISFVQNHILDY